MDDYVGFMERIALYFLTTVLLFTGVMLIAFTITSFLKKESKTFRRSIFSTIVWCALFIVLFFLPASVYPWLAILPAVIIVTVFLRFGNSKIDFEIPEKKYDERDVIFSRNNLNEGTERYTRYYQSHPDKKTTDDNFRKEPGLLAEGSTFYNELLFNATRATFQTVDLLQPAVDKTTLSVKSDLPDAIVSNFIKNWAKKLGALEVGFTRIKPHHLYSHIGRGEDYGKEVKLDHKYAIAFTVEMAHDSLRYNPQGPVVMESAQQYLNAGQIAVQLAQFLRNLGHDARAHIDANYRLICPTVAMDAGLGEIGRMGLLITPKHGPRVRIGIVSTNLELPLQKKARDYSVSHFCNICKKCALNCPSQSISFSTVTSANSNKAWSINQEKCFTYWCKVGTDCGRCIAVCPYSHPNSFLHNVVRRIIKRNPINRLIVLKLDDFFYGKRPKQIPLKGRMSTK